MKYSLQVEDVVSYVDKTRAKRSMGRLIKLAIGRTIFCDIRKICLYSQCGGTGT